MSNSHLSRIDTHWSMVRQAHDSKAAGGAAQAQLIERYGPSIKRYLLASMRDKDAADDVFQEFGLRLVRGDFRNADCAKGRFRSLIKTALCNLMIDYYRRCKKQHKFKSNREVEDIAADHELESSGDPFLLAWRKSLLDETWKSLEQLEIQTEKPYYTVLRARVDQPRITTRKLQESLSDRHERIPSEGSFRVFLHRARKRFAAILLNQVAASLENPTDEEVELELIELGLHHFCKPSE